MTDVSTAERQQALLSYVQQDSRVCPQPGKWHELWLMLPNRVQDGSGWEPPLPLILAAWATTPHLPKMMRLRKHIEYAAKHGVLAEVDRFLETVARIPGKAKFRKTPERFRGIFCVKTSTSGIVATVSVSSGSRAGRLVLRPLTDSP